MHSLIFLEINHALKSTLMDESVTFFVVLTENLEITPWDQHWGTNLSLFLCRFDRKFGNQSRLEIDIGGWICHFCFSFWQKIWKSITPWDQHWRTNLSLFLCFFLWYNMLLRAWSVLKSNIKFTRAERKKKIVKIHKNYGFSCSILAA